MTPDLPRVPQAPDPIAEQLSQLRDPDDLADWIQHQHRAMLLAAALTEAATLTSHLGHHEEPT